MPGLNISHSWTDSLGLDRIVTLALDDGREITRGTIVRHKETGDVGAVEFLAPYPFRGNPWPGITTLEDVYVKVTAWREGESRLWLGRQVEIVPNPE